MKFSNKTILRTIISTSLVCFFVVAKASLPVDSNNFSRAEKWVYNQLCLGFPANMIYCPYGKAITSGFIHDIIITPPDRPVFKQYGVDIYNATIIGMLDLNFIRFSYPIQFVNDTFKNDIYFGSSRLLSILFKSCTIFDGNFMGMKVDDDFNVMDCVIQHGNFSELHIGGNLFLKNSDFKNGSGTFNNSEIEGNVIMDKALFEDVLNFSNVTVNGNFDANSLHLTGNDNFNFMELYVKGDAYFSDAIFDVPEINFNYAKFDGSLYLESIHCSGTFQAGGTTIAGGLNMDNSQCSGNVNFTHSSIGSAYLSNSNFENLSLGSSTIYFIDLSNSNFENVNLSSSTSNLIYLDTININGSFQARRLNAAIIKGNAMHFNSPTHAIEFYGVVVDDVIFENLTAKGSIDFSFMKISRNLDIKKCSVKSADLEYIDIGGKLDCKNGKITGNLDLSNAKIGTLDISSFSYPNLYEKNPSDTFAINGLTYNTIIIGKQDNEDSLKKFLTFINNAKFAEDAYFKFEKYLNNIGRKVFADEVYVTFRERDRQHKIFFDKVVDSLLYWLIDYGRKPQLAFGWSLIIVLLGMIIFWKEERMQLKRKDEFYPPYNAWWYSLGLFLPINVMETSAYWTPNPKYKFLRLYMHIHALLGWVLLPLGLAAISGLVK